MSLVCSRGEQFADRPVTQHILLRRKTTLKAVVLGDYLLVARLFGRNKGEAEQRALACGCELRPCAEECGLRVDRRATGCVSKAPVAAFAMMFAQVAWNNALEGCLLDAECGEAVFAADAVHA